MTSGSGSKVRLLFVLFLGVTVLAPLASEGASQKEGGAPWVAAARIIRDGGSAGSGIYLKSGLIITAAHLTATDSKMSVHIAGADLPATLLKQGSFEDVDLSLLLVDEEKAGTRIALPDMQLCDAPPWPGDPVIVIDAQGATRSHIVSPQILPFTLRKFSTLIGDVATTGNSGSGVFDPDRRCLLGIMSRKLMAQTPSGHKDIAKYFVPAAVIREFVPAEFASPK